MPDTPDLLAPAFSDNMLSEKMADLLQASTEKVELLTSYVPIAKVKDLALAKQKEADAHSWVGRIGADPDGIFGTALNGVAGLIAGGSRQIVGASLALPYQYDAITKDTTMSQEDITSWNNYKAGKATPEDMARLSKPRDVINSMGGFGEGSIAPSEQTTAMDMFKQADQSRATARKINDTFNIDSIEHQGTKRDLSSSIDEAFDPNALLIKSGWDNIKTDRSGKAATDLVKGITGLLVDTGAAALNNKRGVAQYVMENAAQLGMGAFGAAGKAGMLASNIGYAADYYQQGIENWQSKNGGQMPDADNIQKIAGWAASLAIAEHVGDEIGVHAFKLGGAGRATEEIGKKSLMNSLKGTAGATIEGALGETLTEGYQGYAEDVTALKRSADDFSMGAVKNMYQNAVIGGLSGGLLSGGVHAGSEVLSASPADQARKAQKIVQEQAFGEAVKNNDPSAFLDPESKLYDPAMAVGVLLKHNQSGATMDTKMENYRKASDILNTVNDRIDELNVTVKEGTEEEQKAAKAERTKLAESLSGAQDRFEAIMTNIENHEEPAPTETDTAPVQSVATRVEQANTSIEGANEATVAQAKEAVDRTINLSMASISHLSPQDAEALANNTDNALTDDQRSFLRKFSEARQAYNAVQSIGKVTKAVLQGNPTEGQMGLKDYRDRISLAITTGNAAKANKYLDMLSEFASSHAEKAIAVQEGHAKYGEGAQIYKSAKGWGFAAPQTYDAKTLREGGQLPIIKPSILKAVPAEAKAIAALRDEMAQAVKLKFGTQAAPTQTVDASVQSVAPTPAPSAKQVATPGSPSATQKNTAPQENNYPQENGKDKARLENKSPENVALKPQSAPKSEEGKKEISAVSDNNPVTTTAPSPESAPDSTVATAPVSQETDPAALATPTQSHETPQTPAIESVAEKAAEGSTYKQKKLGDFYTQSVVTLASVKDFLSSIKSPNDVAKLMGIELTTEQSAVLRTFVKMAKSWAEPITAQVKASKNPDYSFEDGMRYFVREDGSVEENVKTAISYAIFSYVAENLGSKAPNSDKGINNIIGRDDGTPILPEERALFRDVLASRSAVVEALGKRITQALGLETMATTPVNELPRLQMALGAHAMRIVTAGHNPMLRVKEVEGSVLNEMRRRGKTNDGEVLADEAKPEFLEIIRDGERNPVAEAQAIVDASKGTQGVLSKLFTGEDTQYPPTFEPVAKPKGFTKRTDQVVPTLLKSILNKLNKQQNLVRQDKLEIINRVGRDRFLAMMGVTTVDDSVHVANRDSAQARNEGITREVDNFMDFVKNYLGMDNLSKPFFFEHYAMKQQRVGIANSLVNPQLSKIQRFLVYRPSWVTTVDMADMASFENFALRVAEGLDISTDKLSKSQALNKVRDLLKDPTIQAGIATLNSINAGEDVRDVDLDELVSAVQKGKMDGHSLDALAGLAEYQKAKNAGKSTFQVNMLAEVDGVTNGPMLSHLLLGAAESVDSLLDLLHRGGFFETAGAQFNAWRSQSGAHDLYEVTADHVLEALNELKRGEFSAAQHATVQAIETFIKVERKTVKRPLTAITYGSSLQTAIEGMAGEFIENIYTNIEKANSLRNTDALAADLLHKKTVAALVGLGVQIDPKISITDLMESQLSSGEQKMLIAKFVDTFGAAVKTTINKDFNHLLENRRKFNSVASTVYAMYNAAYTGLRNQLIAELIEKGEIAADKAGTPYHELNEQQEAILEERLTKITPVIQTAMSNASGEAAANTGMLVAKDDVKPSKTMAYKAAPEFSNGTKSMTLYARKRMLADIGVALGATTTHSFDAAVAMNAINGSGNGHEVLNLHDAGGVGIGDLVSQGRRMNEALFKQALQYSPAQEMFNTFMRTVRGMKTLLESKSVPAEVKSLLGQALVEQASKKEKDEHTGKWRTSNPGSLLINRALRIKDLAYKADLIRLGTMARINSYAQYAVEGGNYDVSDADLADVNRKLNRLTSTMTEQEMADVAAVNDMLKEHIEAAVLDQQAKEAAKGQPAKQEIKTSDIGTLGKSKTESDVSLTNYFRKNPSVTMDQMAAFLRTQKLSDFQQKLLSSLVKALGQRGAQYQMNYLTKESKLSNVLELPKGPSHAWFVSKDGRNAAYFLSPDFKESGLTVETVLHEMTHAAVAHAIAYPTKETQAIIDELESIRVKAQEIVYAQKMTELAPAVESVQEMVAYGMTNPAFQAILDSFQHNTGNLDNKWISGLKGFIDNLIKLIFGRSHEGMATGLTSLVTNVTGLMNASANTVASKGNINQSMASPLDSLNGEEMYDALATLGTTRLDATFDTKLRNVLNLMEQSVHSPLAAMKQAVQATAAATPLELWRDMKDAGVAQFAKSAIASGFNFTEQEAFALQQVEATIRIALNTKDGSTTALYRTLTGLYKDTRDELKNKISSFHPNPAQAQALYDFVFKMEASMGSQSDYLSRFAALGLTNHEFAKLLDFHTPVTTTPLGSMSMGDRLHALFERFLEWINQRATNTFKGQKADEKLDELVKQLVSIEQLKRLKVSQSLDVAMDTFEKMFGGAVGMAKVKLNEFANQPFFKNSTNGVVRMTGRITSLVATDRVGQYMDHLQAFRDKTMQDRIGVLMGLVNETRGVTEINAMFHKLLRMTKHIEGLRKDLIDNTARFVSDSFKDGGEYLTDEMHKAVAYGFLYTDAAALLDHFDMEGIAKLYGSKLHLSKVIGNFETQLAAFPHANAYINGARNLGLFMAQGKVGAENLRLNAENIAQMLGTEYANTIPVDVAEKVAKIVDPLVSLYAISKLDNSYLSAANSVLATEMARTDTGNGIEMVLKMHKDLQQQSKDRLFQGAGALRMKGYTPQIYNPYIRLEVGNDVQGNDLMARGFEPGLGLTMDQNDPANTNDMKIYKLRDGGLTQYLTGVFSYTGSRKRGTPTHNGDLGLLSVNGLMNRTKMNKIMADQKSNVDAQSRRLMDPETNGQGKNFLVPVFNDKGEVVNYRYMMSHAARDGLLERDNTPSQLLGMMAGNIFDKEESAKQNEVAVKALHDQFKQDYAQNASSYIEVGPNSMDDEARQVWNLLPESTREAVRSVWGTNGMQVRYDMLDMNFGYRKLSMATPFGVPEDQRSHAEAAYTSLLEAFFGKKAELYVKRFEEVWQGLVKEAKDTMVIKSGTTLLGNFSSNISELVWFGVPFTDIWKHHRTALKGISSFRKDSKRLAYLENALRVDHLDGMDRGEVKREIVKLKTDLHHNPIRELVEAGMMPTIVEDTSEEDDKFSYRSMAKQKVDDLVGNLNPVVLKGLKYATLSHDTPIYQGLSYLTQVSDFVARYTLYQHVMNNNKTQMDNDTALQLVSDAFVNYDVPSHRSVQFANDMGLVYFSKYYLRIQKVIALLYKKNPGRAMMLLTAGHFLDFVPMLTHSAMLHRIGNPFSTGAFEAMSSVNELMSVKALMAPFR